MFFRGGYVRQTGRDVLNLAPDLFLLAAEDFAHEQWRYRIEGAADKVKADLQVALYEDWRRSIRSDRHEARPSPDLQERDWLRTVWESGMAAADTITAEWRALCGGRVLATVDMDPEMTNDVLIAQMQASMGSGF